MAVMVGGCKESGGWCNEGVGVGVGWMGMVWMLVDEEEVREVCVCMYFGICDVERK